MVTNGSTHPHPYPRANNTSQTGYNGLLHIPTYNIFVIGTSHSMYNVTCEPLVY